MITGTVTLITPLTFSLSHSHFHTTHTHTTHIVLKHTQAQTHIRTFTLTPATPPSCMRIHIDTPLLALALTHSHSHSQPKQPLVHLHSHTHRHQSRCNRQAQNRRFTQRHWGCERGSSGFQVVNASTQSSTVSVSTTCSLFRYRCLPRWGNSSQHPWHTHQQHAARARTREDMKAQIFHLKQ
jgi:hypothetical protein